MIRHVGSKKEQGRLRVEERDKLFWKALREGAEKVGSSVEDSIRKTLQHAAEMAEQHSEACDIPFHDCAKAIGLQLRQELSERRSI